MKHGSRLIQIQIVVLFLMLMPVVAFGDVISFEVQPGLVHLDSRGGADVLNLDGFGTVNVPGSPQIPSRLYAIAVPPGATITGVSAVTGDVKVISRSAVISPAPVRRVIGEETGLFKAAEQKLFSENYQRIYARDAFYPAQIVEFVRPAMFRKYQLVDVRVFPVQFNPVSGELVAYSSIRIDVSYTPDPDAAPMLENLPRMEARAREIIANYNEIQSFYPTTGAPTRGLYDLVIITNNALTATLNTLVDWESLKGRNVNVVTTEWIDANYTGTDLAAKMREFLREKYPASQWGIEDVLLAGNHSSVPMRVAWQDLGYGRPRTDFYFAELSQPDSQSWDSNNNGRYLEDSDSCDFYAEVNVGRIPWSDAPTMTSIVEKTVAYEMNTDPNYKKNILLLGAYFWDDTDNAELMEAVADQTWMADWTMTRMYEQNSDYWSTYTCDQPLVRNNVVDEWSGEKYGFVDWAGHGSPTSSHILGNNSAAFITSSDCNSLNDSYPSIIFADACSNSDTSEVNIGQAMLKRGAVGFVGATSVALGSNGWSGPEDGSTQTLDYYFTTSVTSGDYSQGAAHQRAMYLTYQLGGFYYERYEIAEWSLWGHPNVSMGLVLSDDGRINTDKEQYGSDMTINVKVMDLGLDSSSSSPDTVTVTCNSDGGDSETLELTETGDSTAVFTGSIELSLDGIAISNGVLEVADGDIVEFTYIDADDGLGGVNVPKTCSVNIDAAPPVISDVVITKVTNDEITLEWTTSEDAQGAVYYGTTVPDQVVSDDVMTQNHAITINGLTECTYYFFSVESTDGCGNTVFDDNGGDFYRQATYRRIIIMNENMDTEPPWSSSSGLWAWGQPTGQGGEHGYADPTSGHTGANVYGYNLNGDYSNNMPAHDLETNVVNCSGSTSVKLSFWRWLGVETREYDDAAIQISNDGSTWHDIWINPEEELADQAWTYQEFDISAYADDQPNLRIRWVMGATDGGWVYCGWNIDDVMIYSSIPCDAPTPTPRPPTPTPEPTTPTPTAEPTAEPTPEPTATPDIGYGLYLHMDDTNLQAGDIFNLTYSLENNRAEAFTADVVILLALGDDYWCWPSWSHISEKFDYAANMNVTGGSSLTDTALNFQWPSNVGDASGLLFYGAALTSGSMDILGDLQMIPWEFHD